MDNQPKDENQPNPRSLKIASYMITLTIAVLTGAGAATNLNIEKWFAVLLGFGAFLVMSVSNVHGFLQLVTPDLISLRKSLISIIKNKQLEAFNRLTIDLVRFWYFALCRPVIFWSKIHRLPAEIRVKSIISVILKLSSLLLANALLVFLLTVIQNVNSKPQWGVFVWCWLFPTIIISNFTKDELKEKSHLTSDSSFLEVTWLFLVLAWLQPINGWTPYIGTRILLQTFFWGLAIGCAFGVLRRKETSKFLLILFFVVLIAMVAVSSNADKAGDAISDPIIPPLSELLGLAGNTGTDFNVAIGTIALVGSFLGIFIGLNGLHLMALETIFFYAAWLLLIANKDKTGLLLLHRVVNFDEWHTWNWPGQRVCFSRVAQKYPDHAIQILTPILFYTSRYKFALRQLADYIVSQPPGQTAVALTQMLPYEQFESENDECYPSTTLMEKHRKSQLFNSLFERRLGVYSDLIQLLSVKRENFTHVLLLHSYNTLSTAEWNTVETGLSQLTSIKAGLITYQDLEAVRPLFLLTDAASVSLAAANLKDASATQQKWAALLACFQTTPRHSSLQLLIQNLLKFAIEVAEIDTMTSSDFGNLAILSLEFRDCVDQKPDVRYLGLDIIALVGLHWEKLLRKQIRARNVLPPVKSPAGEETPG
jgi:hypothetical protein